MTQLIKERTINFVPPYESNSSSAEEPNLLRRERIDGEPERPAILQQNQTDEQQQPEEEDRYGRELG